MPELSAATKTALTVLHGSRVDLKPFHEEDITEQYLGWLNDPEVNRYLDVRFAPQTAETVLPYVRSFYQDEEKYMWGIHPTVGTGPVGTVTLWHFQRHHGSAVVGLMIGERDEWGRGASPEAISLVLDLAFAKLGLRRVSAETRGPNYGINFTLRRLGFTLEGKRRKALFIPPNEYVDQFAWGILADEWASK